MPTDAQKFSTGFYLRNDYGTHDSGCGVAAPPGTYNVGFNQAGGGVFAMEWDPERKFIRGWNFVKPNIPSDINSPNPNPETWGMPMAYFPLGDNCTSDHFRNHTIVMDMAFCGGAANYIFPGGVNGCIDVARNQPSAYSEAYWLFDYIKVFCKPGQNCIAQ
uniref:Uncharacterized protein n=1 Tax=Acrobeloides nanus TaxID=290746 RepID=A0A914CX67_9BILA